MIASLAIAKNVMAIFSYRVAILRASFNQLIQRSTTFRLRYFSRSKLGFFRSFDFVGITAVILNRRSQSRIFFEL